VNSNVLKGFICGAIAILIVFCIIILVLGKREIIPLTRHDGQALKPLIFDNRTYVSISEFTKAEEKPVKYDASTNSVYIGKFSHLTKEEFIALKPGMTRNEVFSIVGFPHKDLASGVYTDGYDLEDGTTIGLLYLIGENNTIILKSMSLINKDGSITKIFS
jgi:hypothetical protein